MAATPTGGQGARINGSQSWEEDVKSYVQCQGSAAEPFHSQRCALSSALLSTSITDFEAAERWWAFLSNEEAALAGAGANVTLELNVGAKTGRQAISLFQLYKWATRVLPKSTSEEYLLLWLGYARHQGYRNQHEARETYKTLKDQNIGNASVSASLYVEWAALEVSAGEMDRALSIVRKGIKANAKPISELHALEAKLSAGNKAAGESTATKRVGAANTQHSAATTFLPTPAPFAHRRMRDFTQTNSLDMALSHNAASTLERDAAGDAMTADVSSRAPQVEQQLSLICTTQQPLQLSPVDENAHNSTDTEQSKSAAGAEPAAKAARQARMDVTVVICGGAVGGQQTCHSNLSGGSGTSDEATVTINNNPRLATPALTGHTEVSSGSSANGEAETLELKLRTAAGGPAAGPSAGANVARQQAAAEEPTVMVNRAPRPGLRRAAFPGLRAGPRRIGLGGGAARVLQRSADDSAAEGVAAAAALTDSGNKRKAELEAQVASMEVSGSKRRLNLKPDAGSPQRAYTVLTTPNGSRHEQHNEGRSAQPSAPEGSGIAHGSDSADAAASAAAEERNGGAPEAANTSERSPDETVQVVHRARPPALSEQQAPPMPMGPPHPQRGYRRVPPVAVRPCSNDADETVPLINGGLAAKALRGRQSIAPSRGHLGDVRKLRPGETAGAAVRAVSDGRAAMQSESAPAAVAGNAHAPANCASSQPDASQAASSAQDPDQTVPLSRSGNLARSSAAPHAAKSERPRLVPPPPPPTFAARPQAPPALPEAGPGGAEHAAAARPVMGPPPSRPRQPLSSISAPQQQQQPAAQPAGPAPSAAPGPSQQGQAPRARRVREDENSVVVRGTRYTKLECVGRGGSSKVYKVMAPNRKIYALKRIRLTGRDHEAATGFINEIKLLQSLRGYSNIIQLIDAEVIQGEGLIYMVLEYGDIDLARLLARHEAHRREGGATELDENFIRLYWQQMLQAVHTIHEARIVHSDLKPANFLVVEGQLKLIDFGIAKAISSDTTSIAREAQVGTLNYMSPEAILGGTTNIRGGPPMKVGRPSDVWSLGCILYQMVYGHTPFSSLQFIQKMHAITDETHRIAMPPLRNAALADVIRRCLDRKASTRITMQELLNHPFLRPTAAPVATTPDCLVGLTVDQLKKVLAQVSAASASGCPADLDTISEELFRQLSSGQTVNLAAVLSRARDRSQSHSPVDALPGGAQQRVEAPAGGNPGAAAAAISAGAVEPRHVPAPAQAQPRAPLQPRAAPQPVALRAQDIMAGRAALKRVDPEVARAAARAATAESSLEARLREGLAKFRFDDTAGTTAHGDDDDDFST
ncbi:probable dual specificity protein kinase Ttk at C-terminar half [Coccomyxa sp. Obi]|nr:probable dual specificity protein kinase Ttk at C-terminar half [Coccomyxa sp. Obi]